MTMARRPNISRQTRTLLATMLEMPRTWHHGYELSKRTKLKSGTLYPLLMRLNDQGLLEAEWQEPERPGKPARHAYRLTLNGVAFARTLVMATGRTALRRKLAGATA
jgi:DNA-binding PadR family transcriptional regulator